MQAAAEPRPPTVPANAQFSKKFRFWLDEPADWGQSVRQLRLSGWCVAKSGQPLTAIRASLRGRTFEGRFDRERTDVAAYIGMPNAPRWCGFTIDVEVPFGKGRLQLHAAGPAGPWLKVFAGDVRGPLFTSAAEREQRREIDLADLPRHYYFWFDRPAHWSEPTSTLYVSGWCVDRRGGWIHGIRARIGSQIFEANFAIVRKDIGESFPELPAALRSGFATAVALPRGKSEIILELKGVDGSWHPFFRESVEGTNEEGQGESISQAEAVHYLLSSQPARFAFWCDRPRDWEKPARELHVSGWCVTTYGEPITELRARLGQNVFDVEYGLGRPDIALAFEVEPDALRSGFSSQVIVPRTGANFVLEGRVPNGTWEQIITRRVRGQIFARKRAEGSGQIGNYRKWIRLYDTLTRGDRKEIERHLARLSHRPLFSVLLPVHDTHLPWLRRAVESVLQQLYPTWELCIVDDASTDPRVWELVREYARLDSRIKICRRSENGNVCAASNDALGLATGEFVTLLEHDAELAPAALYFAAVELNRDSDLQLIYSDEDKLDERDVRCQPHFKPDWNPDLFTAQDYISHLAVYRLALVRKVGGFRGGLEGAQDYDLALRCSELIDPGQISHIPRILYHGRMAARSPAAVSTAKPHALNAALRAVAEHFERTAVPAGVEPHRRIYQRVRYALPAERPRVSLVIPARDRVDLLRHCVDSILEKTDYKNFEIAVVDNESHAPETLEYFESLKEDERVSLLSVDGECNYSRLNNVAVGQVRGIFVGLLHNDLEVINRDWLSEMVSLAARPQTGAVGARLWYLDDTLRHAGKILGGHRVANGIHGGTRDDDGSFSRSHLIQNFSAVTGACMLVRRETFLEMGGLDEANLGAAFNDIDFCLRLREAGFRIVWTPHAEFYHYESASGGIEDKRAKQRRFLAEEQFMRKKWGRLLEEDPFYNPNFSLGNELFTLAFPPRVSQPWKQSNGKR